MKIEFYETSSGRSPVTEFIDKQPKREQAIILAVLENICTYGFGAKGATFKQLEGKLWEIKIKTPAGGYRLLYVTIEAHLIYILHAFKKKTQKTPIKELAVARKRLKDIL